MLLNTDNERVIHSILIRTWKFFLISYNDLSGLDIERDAL